ncbi:succinyl-CoA--3-ketoacid-CoA transferase [Mycobacterium saskatchewanense]|uniref:Succinyl-CoA--3-ketoacid-CoA transferase n=1 Tax=Mycobacterium saskatchewanense TaxID=220927 RepID=A0AAJ3NNT2_9MYCO|nr:CoA-transferase [Mycobacterium saskatchewanense]ORW68735.1 hypothetical protein AWC23_20845 [Mycobacterium saskatchewanense]BBX64130.1 succinyl-CoA--3-ketoacid-CoA transferase [Mycobacterium saskatchewanense]
MDDTPGACATTKLQDVDRLNAGIGLPMLVPDDAHIVLQPDNRPLDHGAYSPEGEEGLRLINACKEAVIVVPGANFFDSTASIAMIRSGKLDVGVLDGIQVNACRDSSNPVVRGALVKGMGGAMDSVPGARKIIVLMEHCACDGGLKIRAENTLPLTGAAVVNRIIAGNGVRPAELAPGVDAPEGRRCTEALLLVDQLATSPVIRGAPPQSGPVHLTEWS